MSHQCAYRMSIMDSKPTPSFKIELGDKIVLVAHSNVNTLYRNQYQIQVWVQGCVYFSVNIFRVYNIFRKEKYFLVFGCILKIIL